MWRRWKLERSDRIAVNLVWLFVIFIGIFVVIFLRSCTQGFPGALPGCVGCQYADVNFPRSAAALSRDI